MPGLASLVFFLVGLLSFAGGDDGVGSPPAAQMETKKGAASSAAENMASVRSLIANLRMRLSRFPRWRSYRKIPSLRTPVRPRHSPVPVRLSLKRAAFLIIRGLLAVHFSVTARCPS